MSYLGYKYEDKKNTPLCSFVYIIYKTNKTILLNQSK